MLTTSRLPAIALNFLTIFEVSLADPEHRFAGCPATSIDNQPGQKTLLMTRAISHKVEQGKAPCTTEPVDLVFLLDASNFASEGWDDGKSFVAAVVDSLQVGPESTNIAVVKYGKKIEEEIVLDQGISKDIVLEKVGGMKRDISGNFQNTRTCTGESIWEIGKMFSNSRFNEMFSNARSNAQKKLVILTDGKHTDGAFACRNSEAKEKADNLRDDGVKIWAVGIGHYPHYGHLKDMAGAPENVMMADNSNDVATLSSQLCSQ